MKIFCLILSLFTACTANAAQSGGRNDKEVLVRGWRSEELRQILNDFSTMYSGRLAADFRTEVQQMPDGIARVTFPADIPAPLFAWLVNYVRYPKDFDLSARSIFVLGRTTLSSAFEPAEEKMVGQRASFYVPRDDREYDLVFVRVGATTYELSFARRTWKVMADDRMPSGLEALMRQKPNQPAQPTRGKAPRG